LVVKIPTLYWLPDERCNTGVAEPNPDGPAGVDTIWNEEVDKFLTTQAK
jgi:hypothetical protein